MAGQRIAEADLYGTVPEAIAAGGGEAKLKSCGSVAIRTSRANVT